ncbi:MAG: NUDIX hydrolase [Oscillospiraceae bacterium]|jgi:ADP-ribose pyrophosphatase|nr:NUDIX hydrolase [Oscillospiraceae bacterium]
MREILRETAAADSALAETTVAEHVLYRGKIVTLRRDEARLPNGLPCVREVVEHPGGVCVAALTGEQELLLVRQFRYPYGEILLELPAGKLEPGEDPLLAGQRELREETGATAEKYESLGVFYPTPGYCGEKIYMYLARGLTFQAPQPDDDEFLQCLRVPLGEAVRMVLRNEVADGKTQAGVLKTAALCGALQNRFPA